MNNTLTDLGWSAFFMSQLDLEELQLSPGRVAEVHRDRLAMLTETGPRSIRPGNTSTFAVGDWVLLEEDRLVRQLERQSELARKAAGAEVRRQLIAANVDTLFVVTSCNADFNPGRIERYLTLAAEARCDAAVLLTKSDLVVHPSDYVRRAEKLARGLIALPINALDSGVADLLRPWTRRGQTVALLGSSGVGKTTLANALTGREDETQGIRDGDAKGRHTTTHRALRPISGGGWLIDTPGMRELQLADVTDGIDTVFADIAGLANGCRFRDCAHEAEPGCAVQAAIAAGTLDPRRVVSWRKLKREDRYNTETLAEARDRHRKFGKMIKHTMKEKNRNKS